MDALREAGVRPGMTIADVACGPGALSLAAARAGARVHAVDFSERMVALLAESAAREGLLAVEARVGNGMALPLADGAVDLAFCMFGLMFFPDRSRGFRELLRVLKPGGKALVTSWVPVERTPVLREVYLVLGTLFPDLPLERANPPLCDAAGLLAEMSLAGFREVEVREVSKALVVPSAEALFGALERSTPPLRALKEMLGPYRWPSVKETVEKRLHETFGGGERVVRWTANLGTGRR